MALNTEVKHCTYCYRPNEMGGHNDGCPVLIGTDKAMAEWKKGYLHGLDKDVLGYIQWFQFKYYSKTYGLGYRAGSDECEAGIQRAAADRDNYNEWE